MNKTVLKGIVFVAGAIALYIMLFFLLHFMGIITEYPDNLNLKNWDASWYHSIVKDGYFLDLENQCNAGFFPGFPYFWKFTQLPPLGIAFINSLFFLSGLYILKRITRANLVNVFIVLALPSAFFMFTPYSEALFYFLAVFFLVAWQRNNHLLIVLFALSFSFVRPVFFFLIPALIGLFLLKKYTGGNLKKSILTFFSLLAGASIGFALIGLETGDFFAYSKSQVVQWEHEFKLPSYPLTTWRGYRILWLDGMALFLTVAALLILAIDFFNVHFKNLKSKLTSIEVIALGYLLMILVYILFFHPVEDGRTTILSMNRYVFCNPFLHFILLKRLGSLKLTKNSWSIILTASVVTIVLLGFPFYEVIELTYSASLVFLVGLMVAFTAISLTLFEWKYNSAYTILLAAAFLLLQLYLYNSFLKGNWIG